MLKEFKNTCVDYYETELYFGHEILELREQIKHNDRVVQPKYYNIDIDPEKVYCAVIIYEDISALTSIYVEDFIKEY